MNFSSVQGDRELLVDVGGHWSVVTEKRKEKSPASFRWPGLGGSNV
jgi:hypothetical protein